MSESEPESNYSIEYLCTVEKFLKDSECSHTDVKIQHNDLNAIQGDDKDRQNPAKSNQNGVVKEAQNDFNKCPGCDDSDSHENEEDSNERSDALVVPCNKGLKKNILFEDQQEEQAAPASENDKVTKPEGSVNQVSEGGGEKCFETQPIIPDIEVTNEANTVCDEQNIPDKGDYEDEAEGLGQGFFSYDPSSDFDEEKFSEPEVLEAGSVAVTKSSVFKKVSVPTEQNRRNISTKFRTKKELNHDSGFAKKPTWISETNKTPVKKPAFTPKGGSGSTHIPSLFPPTSFSASTPKQSFNLLGWGYINPAFKYENCSNLHPGSRPNGIFSHRLSQNQVTQEKPEKQAGFDWSRLGDHSQSPRPHFNQFNSGPVRQQPLGFEPNSFSFDSFNSSYSDAAPQFPSLQSSWIAVEPYLGGYSSYSDYSSGSSTLWETGNNAHGYHWQDWTSPNPDQGFFYDQDFSPQEDAYIDYRRCSPIKPRRLTETSFFKSRDPRENRDNSPTRWADVKALKDDEERKEYSMKQFGNLEMTNPLQNLTYHGFRRSLKAKQRGVKFERFGSLKKSPRLTIIDGVLQKISDKTDTSASKNGTLTFREFEANLVRRVKELKFRTINRICQNRNRRSEQPCSTNRPCTQCRRYRDRNWGNYLKHFKAGMIYSESFLRFYFGKTNVGFTEELNVPAELLENCTTIENYFSAFNVAYGRNETMD